MRWSSVGEMTGRCCAAGIWRAIGRGRTINCVGFRVIGRFKIPKLGSAPCIVGSDIEECAGRLLSHVVGKLPNREIRLVMIGKEVSHRDDGIM